MEPQGTDDFGTVGSLLARVGRAHRGSMGERLARIGLHVGQDMVLLELAKGDGLHGRELSRRLGVEPPTITKMIQRLEALGLVEKYRDSEDGRCYRLHITEEGREKVEEIGEVWRENEVRLLEGMSVGDTNELRRLLWIVRENLGAGNAAGVVG